MTQSTESIVALPIPANGKIEVYSHPVADLKIFQLRADDPYCRKFYPAFVERCLAFIDVTQSDTDPLWLGNVIYYNAFNNTKYIHCLVAINEKEEIRAHTFSYVQQDYKLGIHLHILQIWKSEGGEEIIEKGLQLTEEFAKEQNIKTITYSADSLAKLRLYSKFGFSLHRVLGKKVL